eukprot:6383018-Pyramimonas_sp.AAC.1
MREQKTLVPPNVLANLGFSSRIFSVCVVNPQTNHGESALYAAARYGHAVTVEALVAHGADVDLRSNNGAAANE